MTQITSCESCGADYDAKTVRRIYGELPDGYCSATCYTAHVESARDDADNYVNAIVRDRVIEVRNKRPDIHSFFVARMTYRYENDQCIVTLPVMADFTDDLTDDEITANGGTWMKGEMQIILDEGYNLVDYWTIWS